MTRKHKRKQQKKLKVVTWALAACALALPAISQASFVDKWLDQVQSTGAGPNYFSSQERGYVSVGSYSARWPATVSSPIVTFQAPSARGGCGGIDFFGGSLSFLQPDMLVEKFQTILNNSAGLAFQMALDVLCPKCKQIMNDLEALGNMLNQLASDDCKLATAATKFFADKVEQKVGKARDSMMTDLAESGLGKPFSNMVSYLHTEAGENGSLANWNKTLNEYVGKPGNTAPKYFSKCSPIVSKYLPVPVGGGNADPKDSRSLVEIVGEEMSLTESQRMTMRGVFGDVVFYYSPETPSEGVPMVKVLQPCPNNLTYGSDGKANGLQISVFFGNSKEDYIMDRMSKPAKENNFEGVCTKDPGTNLKEYARKQLTRIAVAQRGRTPLNSVDAAFLQNTPVAAYQALVLARGTYSTEVMIENMSELLGGWFFANMASDMADRMTLVTNIVSNLLKEKDSNTCTIKKWTSEHLQDDELYDFTSMLHSYKSSLAQYIGREGMAKFTQSIELVNRLESIERQLDRAVSVRFGPAVAQRLQALQRGM